jgi:hypothetical protein
VVGGVIGGTGVEVPVDPPKPKNVAPYVLEQNLLSRVDPKVPPHILSAHRGKEIVSTILVCTTPAGGVDPKTTRILSAVPGTKEAVLEAILAWKYKPQPIPLCAPVRLVIRVE